MQLSVVKDKIRSHYPSSVVTQFAKNNVVVSRLYVSIYSYIAHYLLNNPERD